MAHDSIAHIRLSSCYLPLANPISDAKVLTGRQKPMTEIAMLFAEIETRDGHRGLGFSYAKRAGGPGQFAHAKEVAPALIGEDPSDIAKLWTKLCWAGASVGRSGLGVQAYGAFDVALYDLKARRAGLSLAKLLGSQRDSVRCYNTSGGFLHTPIATGEMLTSLSEHWDLIRHRAADYLMPDGPRVGGITPFLKIAALAEHAGLSLGPHFAMELHVHLGAVYATEPWVEHFDWLEPLFNERLEIKDGRMLVPTRPGLGLSLSEQARAWTRETAEIGQRA
ncbi:MAG: hypothetical protein EOO29_45705 [Comamonadaceae bacterium]|nr:MAG: hypothetical protein EOO29_45705 [Comamonadaceae bacterium]